MQSSAFYFAYGSNLFPKRLEQRIGYCRILGVARLNAFQLLFHKQGKDGSAKCDAHKTGNDQQQIYGVVYALSGDQLTILNEIEGLGFGYELETVSVAFIHSSESASAKIYLAQSDYINTGLLPYSWYRDFVLYGARFHGLPDAYISRLQQTKVISDPDEQRRNTNENILNQGLSAR